VSGAVRRGLAGAETGGVTSDVREELEPVADGRLAAVLAVLGDLPADPVERAAVLGDWCGVLERALVHAGELGQDAVVEAYRTTPGPAARWPRSYERTAQRLTAGGRRMTMTRVSQIVTAWEKRTGQRA